jgi:hypothetical protein
VTCHDLKICMYNPHVHIFPQSLEKVLDNFFPQMAIMIFSILVAMVMHYQASFGCVCVCFCMCMHMCTPL